VIDRVQWIVTPHNLGWGVPAPAISAQAFGATRTSRLFGLSDPVGSPHEDELIEFDVHRTG
jgi:hypothetical protein